jgi:predicted Zn-dependent protease
MFRLIPCILIVAFVLPLASGCQTAPITGRRQLILISRDQELALGRQSFAEVLKESKLSNNYAATAILQRVGRRIADVAHEPDFEWEFKLIESDQVNAFCLPGGKVAVYTGILPVCKDEAGLAAVVAHEVAHAMARHGAERISQNVAVDVVATGLQVGIRNMDPRAQGVVMAAYGAGSTIGVLLPYSREQEKESDEIGIRLMARAGYNPEAAVQLWQRMSELGKQGVEFLSTHPSHGRRIEELQDLLPKMEKFYRQAPEQYGFGETLPLSAAAP